MAGPVEIATFCVCTPTIDNFAHMRFLGSAMQTLVAFPGRFAFETATGGLSRARDILTKKFLDSGASHMLCIDSDVGWKPEQIQKLLDADKDVISGVYAKRQEDLELPVALNGKREGDLVGATHVPGGFLLVKRAVIERMIGAHRDLAYDTQFGTVWGLWGTFWQTGIGEDVGFCWRWLALGGEIWLHTGVVVEHFGEKLFLPKLDERGRAVVTDVTA